MPLISRRRLHTGGRPGSCRSATAAPARPIDRWSDPRVPRPMIIAPPRDGRSSLSRCIGLGPDLLESPIVDHDDSLLSEESAGLRRGEELVVGPAHAPTAVDGLRLLVAQAGVHRPFVEADRQTATVSIWARNSSSTSSKRAWTRSSGALSGVNSAPAPSSSEGTFSFSVSGPHRWRVVSQTSVRWMPNGICGRWRSNCMACTAHGHGTIRLHELAIPFSIESMTAALIAWYIPRSSALTMSTRARDDALARHRRRENNLYRRARGWRPNRSGPLSAGGGTVDVADRRPAPCPHHDKVALLAAGIALAVDRALRHVQKVAGSGIDHMGPARSRLHPQQPAHDVDRGVVVGMVMPVRCRVRLGPDQPGPHPVNGDGLLSGHARGLLTLDPVTRWHPCDGLCRMHGCCLLAMTTASMPTVSAIGCLASWTRNRTFAREALTAAAAWTDAASTSIPITRALG